MAGAARNRLAPNDAASRPPVHPDRRARSERGGECGSAARLALTPSREGRDGGPSRPTFPYAQAGIPRRDCGPFVFANDWLFESAP